MSTEEEKESFEIKTSVEEMTKLVKLVDDKKLNFNKAVEVLSEMILSGKPVSDYVKAEDTAGISADDLRKICQEAVDSNPKAVEDIRNGKDKAINVMFGYIMKATKGKANIKEAEEIIRTLI
jgi:aspartyl-tRNA(Asn)/glutamyl-tRNA(Gln) amidotransferase subunit B